MTAAAQCAVDITAIGLDIEQGYDFSRQDRLMHEIKGL